MRNPPAFSRFNKSSLFAATSASVQFKLVASFLGDSNTCDALWSFLPPHRNVNKFVICVEFVFWFQLQQYPSAFGLMEFGYVVQAVIKLQRHSRRRQSASPLMHDGAHDWHHHVHEIRKVSSCGQPYLQAKISYPEQGSVAAVPWRRSG